MLNDTLQEADDMDDKVLGYGNNGNVIVIGMNKKNKYEVAIKIIHKNK